MCGLEGQCVLLASDWLAKVERGRDFELGGSRLGLTAAGL